MRIRPAEERDLPRLGPIERAAGRQFSSIGMPEIAEHEPPPVEELAVYRGWVAVDDQDQPLAYVLVEEVDGCAHVEQISVHPDVAGRRIGSSLLDTVGEWAATAELDALTLITFRDVPWNRPYYERLGFRGLADGDLGPGLRARRDAEAAKGLDPTMRACMRREL